MVLRKITDSQSACHDLDLTKTMLQIVFEFARFNKRFSGLERWFYERDSWPNESPLPRPEVIVRQHNFIQS